MLNPLEIEIIWHTDETRKLSDAGMEYDVEDCIHKTVTFYHIDLISPYEWDLAHNFCKIHSCGEYWISPFTYEQVKGLIDLGFME